MPWLRFHSSSFFDEEYLQETNGEVSTDATEPLVLKSQFGISISLQAFVCLWEDLDSRNHFHYLLRIHAHSNNFRTVSDVSRP
jgi:hypothetical protein